MSKNAAIELLNLFTALADPSQRQQAAGELAHLLKADELIVFIPDAETGTLLPAPGFPQTLPGRKAWRLFLEGCVEEESCSSQVTYPDRQTSTRVQGIRGADGSVLVLLGGNPDRGRVEEACAYLPLLSVVLQGEQASKTALGKERVAREAAAQLSTVAGALDATRVELQDALHVAAAANEALQEQSRLLETVIRVNATLAAELDLEKLVQIVTDAGTELTEAQFGAFFYNVLNEKGEAYLLYTLSGAPREAFSKFPMPRNTEVFHPTFSGEGVVRSDDITKDPRYGKMPPHYGMPKGHLPVRSYLAVPVKSRTGEVIGGLFFGHEEPGVFTERAEQIIVGIADQAAIAIENARLYQMSQTELAERKLAEAELRELNETLEERVAERTLNLERVNAELKQRNRELQDFAYVASHDLQEPLRKIRTFCDLLTSEYQGGLDEHGHYYLDRIEHAAERMMKLIAGLLEFSRVLKQGSPLEAVDLNEIIEGVLADLQVRIEETGGRVEVEPLPNLQANPTQMRQLFQNLIGNALKFHREGTPPEIVVSGTVKSLRTPSHEPVRVCRLVVQDNGIGFEPKYTERIFTPFQRLHTRDKYEGTGIGLAICRRIVEHHGGSIAVESTPGAGSTFIIELPQHESDILLRQSKS